jgi:FHS family L-fucose permease-like MFS transporter
MQNVAKSDRQDHGTRALIWLVVGLFFIWGGTTSLNDILIPKLKGLFSLSYSEVMLTQFAFFMAYFVVSVPAGALVGRVGYVRGLVVGLSIMALGALLFLPAAGSGLYWPFLVALFVMAGGITILQVASNPLITTLGDATGASSRLTFAQGFNSLGTTIWPYVGAQLILHSTAGGNPIAIHAAELPSVRVGEVAVVGHIYTGIAIVLALVAGIFWTRRNVLAVTQPEGTGFLDSLSLLRQGRVAFGALALFLYVGAEVSIGSVMVNYLEQEDTFSLSAQAAGERLSLYWGGAMVGRFIGSWLLGKVVPGKLLSAAAGVAAGLVFLSMASTGAVSGWSLISVGLFNSIMFPTVFSLAVEGQGARTPEASGLLCMAIVGGAIVPLLTGSLADMFTIAGALIIPILCYAVIAWFGLYARKPIAH